MQNRFGLPDLGLGLGLRTQHYEHILAKRPAIGFFEIISENFMESRGRPMHVLERVLERYPVVMHGVSLSIGSTDPLNFDYLRKLKALAARINAPWVSDHLCWTGVAGRNVHDLLPVPLSEDALKHVVARIKTVQDFLERPLIVENPSSYVQFTSDEMPEWEFINRMCEDANCGLLLDVNNIYVSAFNHGFDANEYIDAIPVDRIVYHHLAGHTHKKTHILDTHSDHVVDGVWDLYARITARTGGRPTMVEWDEDVPEFKVVHAEIMKAKKFREAAAKRKEAAYA
ncbi:MAG: DUF692 domain-containing protein [Armatimonadetes bacterium]|nr:DUF692 domain-containing protein [Armatimonadota bacterium]